MVDENRRRNVSRFRGCGFEPQRRPFLHYRCIRRLQCHHMARADNNRNRVTQQIVTTVASALCDVDLADRSIRFLQCRPLAGELRIEHRFADLESAGMPLPHSPMNPGV